MINNFNECRVKIMHTIKLILALGIVCLFQAQAANMTDVAISGQNNGEQLLQVTFDGPAPVVNSFSTANPPRIAFDFSDSSVKLAKPQLDLNNSLVKSAMAVTAGNRARLVLNLVKNATYSSEVQGNALIIRLTGDLGVSESVTPRERPAAAQVAKAVTYQSNSNTKIDFRRGENNEGRVVINLPANNIPVDIRRDRGRLLVDLIGVPFPQSQLRKLDVMDYGTPINKVNVQNKGKNGFLSIEPSGQWDYSSYQTDRELVIEIAKLNSKSSSDKLIGLDPTKTEEKVYQGQKLSLNFQNIEIRSVLQVIAEFTKLNIVTSDSVQGTITLRLQDVPWDQALDLILQTKDLGQRKEGSIVRIAPNAELRAEEKARIDDIRSKQENEPIFTETFKLQYKSVEEFKTVLDTPSSNAGGDGNSGSGNSILSSRGTVLIDPRNNVVILKDTPTVIAEMRKIVELLDTPLKQVLIEARVVEAHDDFARDLGVRLGFSRTTSGFGVSNNLANAVENRNNWTSTTNKNNQTLAQYAQDMAEYMADPDKKSLPAIPALEAVKQVWGNNINLPGALSGVDSGSIALLSRVGSSLIGLELSAMQTENKGKLVSTPKLLTADRMEATIKEGQEIPYQESTSSGATSTSFKEAVLGLTVRPQITPDGNIIMDVNVTKNSLSDATTGAMKVQEVKTQVMVENGGTVIIGGIYVEDNKQTAYKVPYLGDIPLLGRLFRRNNRSSERRELLVFLTPRIADSAAAIIR